MEGGVQFHLQLANGDYVDFNVFDATDPEDRPGGLMIDPDGATGFEDNNLRITVEDSPSRDRSIVFPSKRKGLAPSLKGTIVAHTPEQRFEWEKILRRAHENMRSKWAVLTWTNSDGIERRMRVVANSIAIQGGQVKTFLLQWQSDDAAKYTNEVETVTIPPTDLDGMTATTITNDGDMQTWPIVRIFGPLGSAKIFTTNDDVMDYQGSIADGHWIEWDMSADTSLLDGDILQPAYDDISNISDFFPLLPGDTDVYVDASGTGTGYVEFYYRDAWS